MKVLGYAFCLCVFFCSLWGKEPVAVYATFQSNPAHAMTICWLTDQQASQNEFKYREVDTDKWFAVAVSPRIVPNRLPFTLYVIELEELRADCQYEFVLQDQNKSHFFRTLPEFLSRPVQFVVGGDAYHDNARVMEEMNRIAAEQRPDFAIVGGDIAYAGSKLFFLKDDGERWIQYLKVWSRSMIQKNGTLIPIIATIGNHDINGRFDQTPKEAPFYYFFFPTHEYKYRVLEIGHCVSFWLLDSGHAHPVAGAQTDWLADSLSKSTQEKFRFAVYHVPAYPSVRSYAYDRSIAVRKHWVPLFEAFHLTAGFEHHDHAYKRTHLIRNGKRDEEGVLYLGDGAWGVENPRMPKSSSQTWYLAKTAQQRHLISVTLENTKATFKAINAKGEVFDTFHLNR